MGPVVVLFAVCVAAGPQKGREMTVEQNLERVRDHQRPRAQRIAAIEALGASKSEAAVVPLVYELQRSDGDVAAAIEKTLARLGAAKVLARDLGAAEDERRLRSAELLFYVPSPDALDALLRALKDPAPKVREHAAAALWKIGDARALDPLAALLAADPDPSVRMSAAQSLGRLGGPRAKTALEAANAREKDAFVRVLIEEALKRIAAGEP